MRRLLHFLFPGLIFYLVSQSMTGQYSTSTFQDPLKAQVTMENFHDPFAFKIQYIEAPHPSGEDGMRAFLRQRKLEAQIKTPARPIPPVFENRGNIPAPEILTGFTGNNIITGTPLDNHCAVNTAEQVVSTINTHMLVTNNVGFWQGSYKLEEFFAGFGGSPVFFDPRIIYDPQQDRFILVLIQGNTCASSNIVLAFSQTNNPRGAWNLYSLDGCLNDDGTFADYPMIAITDNEFFLTYNEVHADSTWQSGFSGTQIHQINKMNGYNGETLHRKVWTDIRFNGRLLRNICPVRNAAETLPSSLYFLSDRNFDISNDTVFLLHLEGHQDNPNASLDMEYRILNKAYGVPPYAVQPTDSLDTNDARILDAFSVDGRIQWVSNTMDFNTGRSAVFHGMLTIDDPTLAATGNVISHPTDYLGYPGLAWTGSQPDEQDAIIVMSHSSKTRNPGGSAIYSNGLGEYSEFITVIEGQRFVNMLSGPIERWGDYIGIQRLYHQPGSVWISCSYGRPGNVNEAWIAKLARPEMVSTHDIQQNKIPVDVYPNPTSDYVKIDFDNPYGKSFSVELMNIEGKQIQKLYDGQADYAGKTNLSFSTHMLSTGEYLVRVVMDGRTIASQKVVKL